MAGLEDLIAAELLKEAGSNTALELGGIFDTLGETALKSVAADAMKPTSERQYGLGESLGVGLVTGLLGGGFGRVGRDIRSEDLGNISTILSGGSVSEDALTPSLYRQANSYKDLLAQNRVDELAKKRAGALFDLDKDLLFERLKRQQEEMMDREAFAGGVSGVEKGKIDSSESSESGGYLQAISRKIPPQLQEKALMELGTISTLEDAFSEVDKGIDEAFRTATTVGTYDPTGLAPSISESAKLYDTAAANITSNVIKIWKGPLDEQDARRIVDPFIPDRNDTPATIAAKKKGLKSLLAGNAKETPILTNYGILDRPNPLAGTESSTAMPSQPVGQGVTYTPSQLQDMGYIKTEGGWVKGPPRTSSGTPLG